MMVALGTGVGEAVCVAVGVGAGVGVRVGAGVGVAPEGVGEATGVAVVNSRNTKTRLPANVSARGVEINAIAHPVAADPLTVPGPVKTCQPAAEFAGSKSAKYAPLPAASVGADASENRNAGVVENESAADGLKFRYSSAARFEPPIALAERADDWTVGAPAGCVVRSCRFTEPLPASGVGSVMLAAVPSTELTEAVVPGTATTDAAVAAAVGTGVSVTAGGVVEPAPPPPLHAAKKLMPKMSATRSRRIQFFPFG
jgi:hypothetical protein